MVKLNISLDSDILLQFQRALAQFGEGQFPAAAFAMNESANAIADKWRGFAAGGSLDGVEPLSRPNRSYLFGVKVQPTGPFQYEIYNETKAAERIAKGSPRLDMKESHTKGPRSRMSEEGIPYLIVPIRWGTPPKKGEQRVGFKNILPNSVYNMLKNPKRFMPTVTTVDADSPQARKTPNARGEPVGRAEYSSADMNSGWGDQLRPGMMEGITNDMVGMSRMLGEDEKATGYFTFRIISARKPRGWDRRPHRKAWEDMWVRKEEPARDVVGALERTCRKGIEEAVEKAIRIDLYDILPK
jgi:hypothetical protein